jgi:excisionase family DNA binding protein
VVTVDVPELARRLNVSRAYAAKLLERGDLPFARDADGRRVVDDATAETYIATKKERQAKAFAEYLAASEEQKR